jgi:hypothetical protein
MGGACSAYGPLGRPRRRWEDIKMDLRNWVMDWIELAEDRDR